MFTERLPKLLDDHPEHEPQLYHVFLRTFARKEEVAAVHHELVEFRQEMGEFQTSTREFQTGTHEFQTEMREFQTETHEFQTETREFQKETRENFARVDRRIDNLQTETREGWHWFSSV